jgi:hypothetical protein
MGQHGSDTINKTNTIYIIIALKNKNKKGRKKNLLLNHEKSNYIDALVPYVKYNKFFSILGPQNYKFPLKLVIFKSLKEKLNQEYLLFFSSKHIHI